MKRIAFLFALAASATFAASAPKATLGNLGLNAQVVTNVDFSGLSVEETDPEFSTFRTNGGTMYGPLKLWNGVGDYDMSTVISSNGVSFWKFMPSSGGGGGPDGMDRCGGLSGHRGLYRPVPGDQVDQRYSSGWEKAVRYPLRGQIPTVGKLARFSHHRNRREHQRKSLSRRNT